MTGTTDILICCSKRAMWSREKSDAHENALYRGWKYGGARLKCLRALGIFVVVVRKKNVCWEAALLQRQKIPGQSFKPLQRSFFSQPTPQAVWQEHVYPSKLLFFLSYVPPSLVLLPWQVFHLCYSSKRSTAERKRLKLKCVGVQLEWVLQD